MAGRKYKPSMFKHASKIGRLLDMMYKPSEIAEELGVTYDTVVRSYIPAGCPVSKDSTGHKWINGKSFAKWADEINKARLNEMGRNSKTHVRLAENQAYCFHCKNRVEFEQTNVIFIKRGLEMVQGKCLTCGGKVNRSQGIKRGEQ